MSMKERDRKWRSQNFQKVIMIAFDEVVNQDDLDGKTRFMAILATLLWCQGVDEFRAMIPAALNFDVTPVEIKEIVYQAGIFTAADR